MTATTRRGLRPWGMTLIELMMVVAIFAIIMAITANAIGPLATRYRTRQGAELVEQALNEAQTRARATGRCHRVAVISDGGVAAPGVAGAALRIERRPNAGCELAPDAGDWSSVGRVSMPNGIVVKLDPASITPEFRPTSRTKSNQASLLRVGTGVAERLVQVTAVGAICVAPSAGGVSPCP